MQNGGHLGGPSACDSLPFFTRKACDLYTSLESLVSTRQLRVFWTCAC